ncbi:hypothetical protein QBC35DRAFT_384308 [Podospora australis]|uniref:Uncharacterized protein n=1 Tax=Podospora australis TaxID=1536484 RepID=A0AAN6WTC5_9PEZI|nr:hypothetical protein QBC35DRAFT_384308 [Podospora australis]
MRLLNPGLGLFVLGIRLPRALGAVRLDLGPRNVQVAEITEGAEINLEKHEILFDDGGDFDLPMRCKPANGKVLTLSNDKKWGACCAPGSHLLGSPETAFDCCGDGHELVGHKETSKYSCCPAGQAFDGTKCFDPTPPPPQEQEPGKCPNGKVLVDGKCVCPEGTMDVNNNCVPDDQNNGQQQPSPPQPKPGQCDSEIQADGQRRLPRLQQEVACTDSSSVNPGDGIRIMDLYGEANSGKNPNQWLNNAKNGGHIGRTDKYPDAGVFTISKWTEGMYCISGLESGVGPTCPSDAPALTFNTLDKESCMPAELVPVPCNIRDPANNCLWSGTNKPCPPGHACVPAPGGVLPGLTPGGFPPGPGGPNGQWPNNNSPNNGGPNGNGNPNGNGWPPNNSGPNGNGGPGPNNGGWPPNPNGNGNPNGQWPNNGGPNNGGPNNGGPNNNGWPPNNGNGNPNGNAGTPSCPPGQPWRDGSCIQPITDCAERAHPEFGDTSYNPSNFPCSAGRERPCRGAQLQDWKPAKLPWTGKHPQPGPPQPFVTEINFDEDVIMSIVDVEAQSEHFLIKLDGEFWGETGGERGYKNQYVGNYNDAEWCLLNGYTRGYFRIPKGKHTIQIEWPQGTGKYKNEGGGNWWYGIAKYRFDKLCDPNQCLPECVEEQNAKAEEKRKKLREEGKWPPAIQRQQGGGDGSQKPMGVY